MAIDPARLGLAVVMLSRRRPMLNLFAFWVGGMVAGVGIALAVLVFMRDVALAAIQGVVSAANEFREAVGILAGGRLHIVIGVIMLLLAARMVARAQAQVGGTGRASGGSRRWNVGPGASAAPQVLLRGWKCVLNRCCRATLCGRRSWWASPRPHRPSRVWWR